MNVVFRADASLQIGTGHVMRCLTLADALAAQGSNCQFICREHQGNLVELIRGKGYIVHSLSAQVESSEMDSLTGNEQAPAHIGWLGSTQEQDAEACSSILADLCPDWLIVDHYSLDFRWESVLKPCYQKLMVIDDLADRKHQCDVLLDQTLARHTDDYQKKVPSFCKLLCGSQYALLRPEFLARRTYSLERRVKPELHKLLVTMGGVDKDNAAGQVLEALQAYPLPASCQIIVVMGTGAPWLAEIRSQAKDMPWPTQVMVGVSDMAKIMADCDLAIGAAGATSWERCCLGLPTIMLVLADNQMAIAQALFNAGAAYLVDMDRLRRKRLIDSQKIAPHALATMSAAASRIADGLGAQRVINFLGGQN